MAMQERARHAPAFGVFDSAIAHVTERAARPDVATQWLAHSGGHVPEGSVARAKSLIRRIEEERGSHVICVIHGENMESGGFSFDDLEDVLCAIVASDRDKPLDIVLVNTRASECIGTPEYLTSGIGMGREATLYLTSRGVRVCGIDAWGWDAPFHHMAKAWEKTRDPKIIWEGNYAGIEQPYCHMEKLQHLETLPDKGFTVSCFPFKIKAASGAWTRAVAMID